MFLDKSRIFGPYSIVIQIEKIYAKLLTKAPLQFMD